MRERDEAVESTRIEDGLIHEHVRELITQLTCGNVDLCQKARRDLVALGRPAVASLIGALENPDERVRWESAKALGQIGDPSAIPALIKALEDRSADVRWVAAESLIALGQSSLRPILAALISHAESAPLTENAYHILQSNLGDKLDSIILPVLNALRGKQPAAEIPEAARSALEKLQRQA